MDMRISAVVLGTHACCSIVRLWGWRENAIEVSRAEKEPGYGVDGSKSDLDPYMQGVAHRNSAYSQLKFSEFS
jgi:hypothetical protein